MSKNPHVIDATYGSKPCHGSVDHFSILFVSWDLPFGGYKGAKTDAVDKDYLVKIQVSLLTIFKTRVVFPSSLLLACS